MKPLLTLIIVVVLAACAEDKSATSSPQLSDLRGQWVVINYWAQWCKPCIEEIPELNKLDQTFAGVTVLGVNYDGATGAELEQQRQQLGVSFASLQTDPSAQLGTPRPVALPTTLIIDPDGQLTATLLGPQTLESLAEATGQTLGAP